MSSKEFLKRVKPSAFDMNVFKNVINANSKIFQWMIGMWCIATLAFVLIKGVAGWNNTQGDFNNYYTAAVLFSEGEAIHEFYDNAWYAHQAQEMGMEHGAKFAPFPPLTTFLYLPLSGFDFLTAKRIWLIFNVLLLFALPFLVRAVFNIPIGLGIFLISLFFIPLASNLNFGQAYLFLIFLIILSLGAVLRWGRPVIGSSLLAILALLKYFPLLFVFYYFKGTVSVKKAMGAFMITGIVLFGVSYFLYPEAYTAYFETFNNHVQGDLSGQGKFAVGFQSIDSMLNNLFVYDAIQNPHPLIPNAVLKTIFKIGFLALIGGLCFLIFKKDHYRFTPINVSIFIFGAFILVPASASYHFLFLLVPVIFIYEWLRERENLNQLMLFLGLLLLTFSIQHHLIPELPNLETFNLIIHYPRLWCLIFLFGYLSYLNLRKEHG